MQKLTLLFTLLITLALSTVIIVFFADERRVNASEPRDLYQVYLGGEKIGVIKSKAKLEAYIDKRQNEIKEKYHVDKVYPPKNLSIQKYVSYNDKILTEEEVYDLISEKSPFTVKGWTFRIKSRVAGEPDKVVNVINYDTFRKASDKTIEAFIPKDEYKLFLEEKQPEIKNTGKIIEDVYVPVDTIYQKQNYISTNEKIFVDDNELTKYLLFGTLDEQEKYTVKSGDTIEQIAFDHQLGTEEFLIVNPEFNNANSLLSPGQQVSVGLISPLFDIVVEEHIVEDQEIKFETETKYDSTVAYGKTEIQQTGSNGIERVTMKRQMTNGAITNVQIVRSASKVIKEPVKQIVVKGTKNSNGGTVTISPDGKWVWPTLTPYIITSSYGYRWGKLHAAIDISGTGYGSPIFAARAGVVITQSYDSTRGNYIVLKHDNDYYTIYLHLAKAYVKVGQEVKAGQTIAGMGNTGYVVGASGTHLHFGVHVGEPYTSGTRTVNPLTLYR